MIDLVTDKWIGIRRPSHTKHLRLFAFSYAGGGASIFRRWLNDLDYPEWLDFIAIQLPGRERRITEPPFTDLKPLLDKLQEAITPMLDTPYILLGYSMGSILAYELALQLEERNERLPEQLILAAQMAPDPQFPRRIRHTMSREDFIAELRFLGGTAPDILDNDQFMDHYLKTLRADFAIVDRYKRTDPRRVPCPIFVLGGVNDPEVSMAQLDAWQRYTDGDFDLRMFPGGHFFLHSAHSSVMQTVNGLVMKYAPLTRRKTKSQGDWIG